MLLGSLSSKEAASGRTQQWPPAPLRSLGLQVTSVRWLVCSFDKGNVKQVSHLLALILSNSRCHTLVAGLDLDPNWLPTSSPSVSASTVARIAGVCQCAKPQSILETAAFRECRPHFH